MFSLVAQSAGKGLFEISRLSPFRGKDGFPGDVGSALHHSAWAAGAGARRDSSASPGPVSEGCNASAGEKCSVFFFFLCI